MFSELSLVIPENKEKSALVIVTWIKILPLKINSYVRKQVHVASEVSERTNSAETVLVFELDRLNVYSIAYMRVCNMPTKVRMYKKVLRCHKQTLRRVNVGYLHTCTCTCSYVKR